MFIYWEIKITLWIFKGWVLEIPRKLIWKNFYILKNLHPLKNLFPLFFILNTHINCFNYCVKASFCELNNSKLWFVLNLFPYNKVHRSKWNTTEKILKPPRVGFLFEALLEIWLAQLMTHDDRKKYSKILPYVPGDLWIYEPVFVY
jgi:hypothetical protein